MASTLQHFGGMRQLVPFAIACAVACATSVASAQRPDASYESESEPLAPTGWLARPWTAEAEIGGGAPLGTTGIALGYTPLEWATVAGGVGLAQGNVQGSLMPRVHQPLTDTFALAIGAGISFGRTGATGRDSLRRIVCSDCDETIERTYAFAWWGNAEISLEERRPWGLAWRIFVGGARVLNPSEGTCNVASCTDHRIVAYAGVGIGWTFAL